MPFPGVAVTMNSRLAIVLSNGCPVKAEGVRASVLFFEVSAYFFTQAGYRSHEGHTSGSSGFAAISSGGGSASTSNFRIEVEVAQYYVNFTNMTNNLTTLSS